ncbi:MAG: Tm-1-like ATP-binding domain-containing protein, partial [Verrucomicrobia bacterium]|nr:Tm-1-like ATP-binding domain-containing protein [Verrucomicrobiota bacterium]
MAKTILLIGTLDTKGAEYACVRDLIVARGHRALTMNAGVAESSPHAPREDISAAEVAEAGGGSLAALRAKADRGAALDVMTRGVDQLVAVKLRRGERDVEALPLARL